MKELEEGNELTLDFNKLTQAVSACPGVIPVAVQYVNELALKTALAERTATFWSTSRNELWIKGKTSGETFELLEVRVNCEQNSLVYIVRPRRGGICHTKNQQGEPRDCYYRTLDFDTGKLVNLDP